MRLDAQPAGGELHLNADAVGGSLVVELTAGGGPVRGFEAAKCVPMSADSLDHVVRWDGDPSPAHRGIRPVHAIVKLTNAELFSLWWE